MKSFSHSIIRTVILIGATGVAMAQPTIEQQIDALLKTRLKPQALPVDPPNPFREVKRAVRDAAGDQLALKVAVSSETDSGTTGIVTDLDTTTDSNARVLAACISRLKIGGIMQVKDQVHIVINDLPRREGDFIGATWRNTTVALRIVRILPGEVAIRFGDAETTLKF
jgi:hypothetical protein